MMNLVTIYNLIPDHTKHEMKLLFLGVATTNLLYILTNIVTFTPIIKFVILCIALLSGLVTLGVGIIKFIEAFLSLKKKLKLHNKNKKE